MSNTDKAHVDGERMRKVIRSFAERTKTGRVFFPGDSVFKMKYESFLKAADAVIDGHEGGVVHVTDQSLHEKGDKPVPYEFYEADVLALFDNTKIGWFGNILKKDCQMGALFTTKGILCYNVLEGKVASSGFLSWITIANCTSYDAGGCPGGVGVQLFRKGLSKPHRKGPRILLIFHRAKARALQDRLDEMIRHLKFIARGTEGEFDNLEYLPERLGEADDAEGLGEADDAEGLGE